jgi:tRNA (cytidine/uridine-2'-O-)-methyltransferase
MREHAMEIVILNPEIPHNTGCAARLAAATEVRLHLVEPLGFSLDSRHLKRAGLDYWPKVEMLVHSGWSEALSDLASGSSRPVHERLRPFSARGGESLFAASFQPDDILLFGCESKGLPPEVLKQYDAGRVYVPIHPGVRSLNLANVICLGLFTALDRSGSPLPSNDGAYDGPGHAPVPAASD